MRKQAMALRSFIAPWLLSLQALGQVNETESLGISMKHVHADGLVFDCRFAGEGGTNGDVMMLHGFPEWSKMWEPLMIALAPLGYRSVACNQRGYSPGASPDIEEDYDYNLLRDDVWAVADAVGFQKFHLVGHGHGALLGWWTAGSSKGAERILSYSGLSVPHPDAFSAGLLGPDADLDQQMASQYFSIFTLKNSASLLDDYLYKVEEGQTHGFHSAKAFQKALWWYNGAEAVGVNSEPPDFTASFLFLHGSQWAAWRALFGYTASNGISQKAATGIIKMPALFVCGIHDSYLLCNRPYALRTKDYCPNDYQHVAVDCGHWLMSCKDPLVTDAVVKTIVNRITSAAVHSSVQDIVF